MCTAMDRPASRFSRNKPKAATAAPASSAYRAMRSRSVMRRRRRVRGPPADGSRAGRGRGGVGTFRVSYGSAQAGSSAVRFGPEVPDVGGGTHERVRDGGGARWVWFPEGGGAGEGAAGFGGPGRPGRGG